MEFPLATLRKLQSILPILLDLVNCSLIYGEFPTLWKKSCILPIPKVSQQSTPSDYRPISFLYSLSKSLERIVHQQLSCYMEKHNLFDKYQAGFRQGHNTQTALLCMTNNIRRAIDRRLITIDVFFYFSKAFDRVDHGLLLTKLARLGCSISVLQWFQSYLTDRSQAILGSNNTSSSSFGQVLSGVPQGSILGPLFFLIFVLDLLDCLRNCMYVTFADDLQIYFHCPLQELNDGLACVHSDIAAVTNWVCLNGLLLNANKTKVILIGTARYINRIDFAMLNPLIVDGTSIAFVNSARALGVTLNSTLTWNDHVLVVWKQIFKILFQLKHSSHMLSQTLLTKLISNLVIPLLDYACVVYIDVTKEQNLSLQRALNACIRFIYSARRDDHISGN